MARLVSDTSYRTRVYSEYLGQLCLEYEDFHETKQAAINFIKGMLKNDIGLVHWGICKAEWVSIDKEILMEGGIYESST